LLPRQRTVGPFGKSKRQMRNRIFHQVSIAGMTFEGIIAGDGPYLSCRMDGGVALGPAGLRYFQPEPWGTRRTSRSAGGS
jgi:hypothetical protein